MSTRAASWLAWSLAGLSAAIAVASLALSILPRSAREGMNAWSVLADALVFASFLAFPLVGALIASRRPRNPIGWICLTAGFLWMLITLGEGYSSYGLAVPGSVPFPVAINALLYGWMWVPTVGLIGIYLILLFPDGRLPSARWRTLAWLAGAVVLLESAVVFLTPGPLEGLGGARNPFGLEGHPWLEVVGWVVLPLLPLCMIVSALSLVLRFRRSGGEIRQQIKWIAFAASFMGSIYLLIMGAGFIDWLVSASGVQGDLGTRTWWGAVLEDIMLLSFAAVPVAIGFAILKHRLYDIDVIVNRALVYGLLTVTLVLIYVGVVVVLQYAFRAATGGESQLAVVGSTLAIAALFSPLRRRIQAFIDRRFYRKKYNARRTLEAFSTRLRDGVDPDQLASDLTGVIRETVQPAYVSFRLVATPSKEDDV